MANAPSTSTQQDEEPGPRHRILDAAFALFTSRGYTQTNTLEIATQAKVSKRDLYALVGTKEDMLTACITERATRLRWPQDIPRAKDRNTFVTGLEQFGYQLLQEVTDPTVVSVFRLAITEATRTPEVARTLDNVARATVRDALSSLFSNAKASGFIQGEVTEMTRQYSALLWEDLMLGLLLGIVERPSRPVLKQRAHQATTSFMKIHASQNEGK